MIHWKETKLQQGLPFNTSEKGNSMVPLLKSGQSHELSPCTWEDCIKGDIVFCKVKGNYYTHLVLSKDWKKGVQIGNAKGRINGWTKQVYGKVTQVYQGQ